MASCLTGMLPVKLLNHPINLDNDDRRVRLRPIGVVGKLPQGLIEVQQAAAFQTQLLGGQLAKRRHRPAIPVRVDLSEFLTDYSESRPHSLRSCDARSVGSGGNFAFFFDGENLCTKDNSTL
jgi:hypothetical protein